MDTCFDGNAERIEKALLAANEENLQLKQALAEKDKEIAHLKEKVAHYDRWLSAGVYFTGEEYQERVYKPHQQLMAKAVRFAKYIEDEFTYNDDPSFLEAQVFLSSPTVQQWRKEQS